MMKLLEQSIKFTATFATYLLAGIAGAPVFAPATGATAHGLARLTGATGGYLVGMLVATFVLIVPLLVIIGESKATYSPSMLPSFIKVELLLVEKL